MDPAWTVINNDISQSEHTNPDSNRNNKYRFDHSFGPTDDNRDIYDNSVRDSVISAMEGYHASVFAYGQTATGKTFTMTGGGSHLANNGSEGVIQMAIRDCFEYIHAQKSETREYLLRVSFMEIYNEVINDLLASPQRSQPHMTTSTTSLLQNPAAPQASAIRIFESKNEGVIVRGLKEEIVTCPEQVFALLAAGERRRQTGGTAMNKQSSRSHSIFRLIIESRKRIPMGGTPSPTKRQQQQQQQQQQGNDTETDSIASSTFAPASTSGPVRVSTLSLVDLAGSESVKNTGSTGTRQKEGTYINKSLLTLGHVVYKLAEISMKKDKEGGGNDNVSGSGMVDTTHIPYRDSKLTRLLQPSLSGNAQICIICNISPLSRHIEESHLTLKFASRAKKIKQHATITEVVDEKTLLENYREEIEELKNQLKEAKHISQDSSNSQTLNTSSIDDDDVQVLSQAVSNLERLILKTTTADEKKRKQKRREVMARIQVEQGIPANISGGSGSKSSGGNTLLNGLFNKEEQEDENTLLNSLSLDDYSQKMDSKATISSFKDDQSLGSLGDESTVVEGKKLVNELHRIQGLLATVLKKKGSTVTPSVNVSVNTPITGPPMIRRAESEVEVERLRAQLHEQAVHSSLRMADSTFLQAQLQEKDALLKDISQILEAVEKRQVELETENDRLKLQWHNGMSELRGKESETIILEKLIKKRDDQIKGFKAQLAGDEDESEGE